MHFRHKYMYYSPGLLNPLYFPDCNHELYMFVTYKYIYVYLYIYVCINKHVRSAADVFTAHGRGHVRIITLRLFPAAAAEWAKPREIRRGTP